MVFFKRDNNRLLQVGEQLLINSPTEASLMAAACTPIDGESHPAVITYFNDRSIQSQLEWLDGLLPDSFAGRISESYIAPIANRSFRIFVVCGNDPKRMVKLMRHYRNLIGRKLCVAMMLRSTPSDRVRLFNAGFDEVLDLRSSHIEATCRLNAHLRRIETRARLAALGELPRAESSGDAAVDRLAHAPLSERERLVLGLLHQRIGQLTTTTDIHREIRRRYGRSHTRSLHVVISLLRKKLHHGYGIVYRTEGGYVLLAGESGAAAGANAALPAHGAEGGHVAAAC